MERKRTGIGKILVVQTDFFLSELGVKMVLETLDRSWTLGVCETCLRNAHERHEMQREFLVDTKDEDNRIEVWVCPNCGSTRRL